MEKNSIIGANILKLSALSLISNHDPDIACLTLDKVIYFNYFFSSSRLMIQFFKNDRTHAINQKKFLHWFKPPVCTSITTRCWRNGDSPLFTSKSYANRWTVFFTFFILARSLCVEAKRFASIVTLCFTLIFFWDDSTEPKAQ